ncbi:MAG: 3-oxoacyl-[acyl-carrier protein] reductase [Miltoncostaeaceae bacterium]|nr:3-oxoacyl-[acyl-carrier protein] reductase [Miltoncostaeaceae bacterium]
MLLEDRTAVIYGGGGSIGGAVARAFAREGARVVLAGRTMATLEGVAGPLREAGGTVETAVVDALDERSVDEHADALAARTGGIDISFNLIGHPFTHGTPMAELSVDDFMAPVLVAARSTFLTARAAARTMIPRRSGVILAFGGPGDRSAPLRDYYLGGTQVAFDAIETMRRQLSVELGPHGIRVVTLETGGVPNSFPDEYEQKGSIAEMIAGQTLLGRAATLEDVGNVAVFAASDWARTMTAATLNISCGALID